MAERDLQVSDKTKSDPIVDGFIKETSKLSLTREEMGLTTDSEQSSVGSTPTQPVEYTEEEVEAIHAVYKKLTEDKGVEPDRIGLRVLALTTIVSKLRVDEAVEKYEKLLNAVGKCNVSSFKSSDERVNELFDDPDVLAKFISYPVCGTDHEGRQIMWVRITEEPVPAEDEAAFVHAAVLYWMACHADAVSLQQGITFCIDTTIKSNAENTAKLQKVNQSLPTRPQAILIAGATLPMRVVINGIIKVASLFTKEKVLQRIRFTSVEEALDCVPQESAPNYLGGGGGNIECVLEWAKERIHAFPIPHMYSGRVTKVYEEVSC